VDCVFPKSFIPALGLTSLIHNGRVPENYTALGIISIECRVGTVLALPGYVYGVGILTLYITVAPIYTVQWSLYVPHSGHYMYRTVVTICTAQWSLSVPHSGH